MFAVAAKGVAHYESRHPLKEELLSINGIVKQIRLGGNGSSTYFQIEADGGTSRYSSYYGMVWPGMELVHEGDFVNVLAEKNKLNKGELINGKQYYIWKLIHRDRVIIDYEDIYELVQSNETTLNRYINIFLIISTALLVTAYIRKLTFKSNDKPA